MAKTELASRAEHRISRQGEMFDPWTVGLSPIGTRGLEAMIGNAGNAAIGCAASLEGRARLLDRRSFLVGSAAGLGALGLAGCATSDAAFLAESAKAYAAMPDEKFPIPAVDISKVDPKYYRRTVQYASQEPVGTIVVDPRNFYVYRIEGGGTATRYGANVGRSGFLWNGDAYVGRKSEWATWTPPKEMIQRQPEAAPYAHGMPGGLDNPLGARTLHLYQNGAYTLYTIYATSEPDSIGKGITSGCVGLLSQDMIHLYAQTPVKTKVVVLPA